MANTKLQIKRSIVPGKIPQAADLEIGELAINLTDARIFSKHSLGNVVVLSDYTLSNSAFNLANIANTNSSNASFLSIGTVNPARLGSGTANTTTFLRGDNSWQSVVTSVSGKTGNVTLNPSDIPGTVSYHGFVFPYEVSLSYNKTNRTFTFTPSGASYDVWVGGTKYTKIGAQTSIAHANTTGSYFLYYNTSGELEWDTDPWDMKVVSPAAYVYYDTVPLDGYALFELHTYKRNPEWHESQHHAIGTFVRSGLEISEYTLNGEGNTATTFQVAAGIIVDEDIEYSINTLPDNGPYTVLRRTGNTSYTWDSTNPVPYLFGPTYIQYNQSVGGVWQMTEVVNSRWVNYFLYAATAIDGNKRLFLIPGQASHSTLSAAQSESNASLDLAGLTLPELVAVWKLTFATNNVYSASGRVRLVEVNRITNTRGALSINLSTTNHNLLTSRDSLESHPATAISYAPSANISSSNVQSAIEQLEQKTNDIINLGTTPLYLGSTNISINGLNSLESNTITLSQGIANGVPYLNSNKQLTTGTKLTFNGTNQLRINDNNASGYITASSGELLAGEDAGGFYFGVGFAVAPAKPIFYGSTGTTYHKWQCGGGEKLRLDSSGNLGINNSSPTYKLDVKGSAKANSLILTENTPSTNTTTGTLIVTGGVGISGALNATTKSFDIPHPSDPKKRLRYGSLESPSHSVRLTGKGKVVDGIGIVDLPWYFKDLVHEEEVNIQLTNIKHGKILWVEEINIKENIFIVCIDITTIIPKKEYEFFWDLTAERLDVDKLIVEY